MKQRIYDMRKTPIIRQSAAGEAARLALGYTMALHPWVVVSWNGTGSSQVDFFDADPRQTVPVTIAVATRKVADDGTVTTPS